MTVTLLVETENEKVPYDCKPLMTIGRTKANDIQISDPKISRNHAIVRLMGDGKYYFMDLGSANGSSVNGRRVVTPHVLADKDRIKIGDHLLEVRQEESVEGDAIIEDVSTMITIGSIVKTITVLVTDIRSYTIMSEQIGVDTLAKILGRWFREANTVVEENSGRVDKFIGDAIMVVWTTEHMSVKDTVQAALRSARGIAEITDAINGEYPDLPFPMKIGVGINSGKAVLGTVGATSKRDYTALGDAVNIAFRLEAASKELKADVVLGPESSMYLPDHVRGSSARTVTVKGKSEPLAVCALIFDQLDTVISP